MAQGFKTHIIHYIVCIPSIFPISLLVSSFILHVPVLSVNSFILYIINIYIFFLFHLLDIMCKTHHFQKVPFVMSQSALIYCQYLYQASGNTHRRVFMMPAWTPCLSPLLNQKSLTLCHFISRKLKQNIKQEATNTWLNILFYRIL